MAKIIEVDILDECSSDIAAYNVLFRDADGPASRTSIGLINIPNRFQEDEIDGLPAPHYLGEVDYRVIGDVLSCRRYYPFGTNPKDTWRGTFLGKGLADQVELLILKDLVLRFGDDQIMVPSDITSSWRKNQLFRRGIAFNGEYSLHQHIRALERK